jgi:hypothetical protein
MTRQEVGIIAVNCFRQQFHPFADRCGGTAGYGAHRRRVPLVSSLTSLSMSGRKDGLLTVALSLCQILFDSFNPHIEFVVVIGGGSRQPPHNLTTTGSTKANHQTLRLYAISCMGKRRMARPVHSSWLQLVHSSLLRLEHSSLEHSLNRKSCHNHGRT